MFGEVRQGRVALCDVSSAVGRQVGDDVMFAVGKRERLHLQRKSQIGERKRKLRMTCLNDVQRAVVLGMNLVDDIQTRAVVVINTLPISIALSLNAWFFLLVLFVQPVVA
jgi:hypothetical protein